MDQHCTLSLRTCLLPLRLRASDSAYDFDPEKVSNFVKTRNKPDYFAAMNPESSIVVEIVRRMVESDRSSFPLRLAACLPQYSLRI